MVVKYQLTKVNETLMTNFTAFEIDLFVPIYTLASKKQLPRRQNGRALLSLPWTSPTAHCIRCKFTYNALLASSAS